MKFLNHLLLLFLTIGKCENFRGFHDHLTALPDQSNNTGMVLGISEMINLLAPKTLAILVLKGTKIDKIDRLTIMIHHNNIPTCIFKNRERYFQYIAENLKLSVETTSLVFCHPKEMLNELIDRHLAHRLSLYMFYWGAAKVPQDLDPSLMREPLRVSVITSPRKNVFRIFYNQAKPNNRGLLLSANWFDGNDMTFQKTPLLPTPTDVYKNFEGRVFTIPVIHKPPWHFVKYVKLNESENTTDPDLRFVCNNYSESYESLFDVTGGRDHNLMQLIANRMNFSFKYVEPEDKIQGLISANDGNASFTGAIGMLQRREVDLFLGDVAITWERMQAVEFSFFTLADSAAFVTHAPRKLNEALALVRPFQLTVWPLVLLTICMSGPVLYMIIALPYRLEEWVKVNLSKTKKLRILTGPSFYHMQYIREMNYGIPVRSEIAGAPKHPSLDRCVWYTINVYLRQSASIPYNGHVARFFSILLWLCATYVLGDVYSAQLTSQLARPALESPINTLEQLEIVMMASDYQLLVERQSAFQAALVNSTGILNRLYRITQRQSHNESYLVSSVEEGVRILLRNSKRAVFGGRETLYFNTKRYGAYRFQMSHSVYTRYSAVAVQFGSPFLDSLNEVIMRLFEAGIIERITVAEYERMFGSQFGPDLDGMDLEGAKTKKSSESNEKLQPMNLRMLQGAFLALAFGHSLGIFVLLLENKRLFVHVICCTGTFYRVGSLCRALRRLMDKFLHDY
ncbi:ionotropic receptor 40a [Uranotaenia lowii]|uniref:ionotropic receptor 40a n=1 Tax=Uranotaenia lowii TaxID=190385 RepID=UPI002478495E|nr:ionotropic receptor 40a [Uranotaenia lowii]